jgi:NAD-dependent SIR2 family protein deacetylase
MDYHYCAKCEEIKPESEFIKAMFDKKIKTCKYCQNKRRRELYQAAIHIHRKNNRKRARIYWDKKKSIRLDNK